MQQKIQTTVKPAQAIGIMSNFIEHRYQYKSFFSFSYIHVSDLTSDRQSIFQKGPGVAAAVESIQSLEMLSSQAQGR